MKNIILKLSALVFCMALICGCAAGCGKDTLYLETDAQVQEADGEADYDEDQKAGQPMKANVEQSVCFVYICGAVRKPGVYEMPSGSRVYEVIEKAGGLKKGAALESFNQAETITDGQMIEIPTYKEQETAAAELAAKENGLVNINTATVAELMTLNGIGESKAAAIVSYREEHGVFAAVEEIKNVSGIGESTYANIRDQITI